MEIFFQNMDINGIENIIIAGLHVKKKKQVIKPAIRYRNFMTMH